MFTDGNKLLNGLRTEMCCVVVCSLKLLVERDILILIESVQDCSINGSNMFTLL